MEELGAVPPGDVLDKGDLQDGVKIVRISCYNILSKFCLVKFS